MPFFIKRKQRWGPVANPVEPTYPITCPWLLRGQNTMVNHAGTVLEGLLDQDAKRVTRPHILGGIDLPGKDIGQISGNLRDLPLCRQCLIERAANDAVDDPLLVGLGNRHPLSIKGQSTSFDLKPVVGVNVVDKTLEPTVVDLDSVWLASPDKMDIVDGPDVMLELHQLGGTHSGLLE